VPKTILTLRDPQNPNQPGEVREFEHVGAIMGGGNNALLTFLNEDIESDGTPNPKPFLAISTNLVYSVETPAFNRAPERDAGLVLPGRMMGGSGRPS
jgi:hypothetical protein